jgi:hypothetical protein
MSRSTASWGTITSTLWKTPSMLRIANSADRIRSSGFFRNNQVLETPVADNPSSRLDGSSPDTGAMLRPPQSKPESLREA